MSPFPPDGEEKNPQLGVKTLGGEITGGKGKIRPTSKRGDDYKDLARKKTVANSA